MRYTLIFAILILSACQSEINNKYEIARIDALPFAKYIFELKVGENDNIMDTISIEKIKYNTNFKLVYSEREMIDEYPFITKSYNDETEDVFYRETYIADESDTFEAFKDTDGKVTNALMITNYKERSDTIFMDMEYEREITSKEKVKKMIIKARHSRIENMNSIDERFFNENEQLIKYINIKNNDTTSQSVSTFIDSKLNEVRITNYNDTTLIIFKYNERELLAEEENYKWQSNKFSQILHTTNTYDEDGELIRSVETDLVTGLKSYAKYVFVEVGDLE